MDQQAEPIVGGKQADAVIDEASDDSRRPLSRGEGAAPREDYDVETVERIYR